LAFPGCEFEVKNMKKMPSSPAAARRRRGKPAIDRVGVRFGCLTGVRRIQGVSWEMRCDCGQNVTRNINGLVAQVKRGWTPRCESCQARDRERARQGNPRPNRGPRSYAGEVYGQLTAIEPVPGNPNSVNSPWRFQCSCGREHVLVLKSALFSPNRMRLKCDECRLSPEIAAVAADAESGFTLTPEQEDYAAKWFSNWGERTPQVRAEIRYLVFLDGVSANPRLICHGGEELW
jgi:hypothetical protein